MKIFNIILLLLFFTITIINANLYKVKFVCNDDVIRAYYFEANSELSIREYFYEKFPNINISSIEALSSAEILPED